MRCALAFISGLLMASGIFIGHAALVNWLDGKPKCERATIYTIDYIEVDGNVICNQKGK